MSHVFISYSHSDTVYAHRLAAELESQGFAIWIDERIETGDRWFRTITKAILACDAFVVVMTPEAEDSEWVEKEVLLAQRERKPIFPLLFQGKEFPLLITVHYEDVTSGDLPPLGFYNKLASVASQAAPSRKDMVHGIDIRRYKPEPEQASRTTKAKPRPVKPPPPKPSFTLPMLEWIDIPSGSVVIENHGTFHVSDFSIAKYPVTVQQYEYFVNDDGYEQRDFWTDAGWAWLQDQDNNLPSYWNAPKWHVAKHPIVGVSWYEVIAYCEWLSAKLVHEITLPTEMQWQRAAQGDDGRKFPWGDELDASRCNSEESGIGATTFVDRYPSGASPYGVYDLAGNVYEWCLNEYRDLDNMQLSGTKDRPFRGGAWGGSLDYVRCVDRDYNNPYFRHDMGGFRLSRVRPPS